MIYEKSKAKSITADRKKIRDIVSKIIQDGEGGREALL